MTIHGVWGAVAGAPKAVGTQPERPAVVVYIKRSGRRWPLRRAQRYFWTAVAANGRTLGRSSETYTNRGDCEAMARKLFQPAMPWPVVVHSSVEAA